MSELVGLHKGQKSRLVGTLPARTHKALNNCVFFRSNGLFSSNKPKKSHFSRLKGKARLIRKLGIQAFYTQLPEFLRHSNNVLLLFV